MTEDISKLRATLAKLRDELARVEPTDPEIHALLTDAAAEIQARLNRSGAAAEEHDDSIIDRLKQAAEHYEHSHPTLSGIVGSIVDALSRMGI